MTQFSPICDICNPVPCIDVCTSCRSPTYINLITAPAFIATKLEAFKGRGNNDFLASHDMEDIITVVDGRATLLDEVSASDAALRSYLIAEFASLVRNQRFVEALGGHLPGDPGSQGRLPRLRARLRAMANEMQL